MWEQFDLFIFKNPVQLAGLTTLDTHRKHILLNEPLQGYNSLLSDEVSLQRKLRVYVFCH